MERQDYPFSFTGSGGEYFRIWIVNILLTVLTLGIYSAWAKVRTQRYFYGNTILDGSSFEYTAEPMRILRGRVVAVVVLILYQGASYVSPQVSLIALAIFMLAVPALIVMSMRFRMRYTSWRNIQFGFIPNFKYAYLLFGLPILLVLALSAAGSFIPSEEITPAPAFAVSESADSTDQTQLDDMPDEDVLDEEPSAEELEQARLQEMAGKAAMALVPFIFLAWLLFPLWQRLYYKFVANHSQYGMTPFRFIATTTEFYSIYLIAGVIFLGAAVLAGVIGAAQSSMNLGDNPIVSTVLVLSVASAFFLARAYMTTQLTNTIYGNLELQEIGFRSELKVGKMAWLYFSNTVAILLSLGLLIPWAQIRMARYRAETMTLHASNFNEFQARAGADIGAQGAEVSDFMDIDIGI